MKVVHKADESVTKVWCGGKIQTDSYRLFTYLVSAEADGGKLLLNTVTGELIFLDTDEVNRLSLLHCAYDGWMDELIRKRFLVKEDADDKKTVDTLRKAYRLAQQTNEITAYTILPTTNCNARCFYCYEAGCTHENMSDETAEKLVDFIETHHGKGKVHFNWFGGEPLLGIRQIDRICNALKEKNIEFLSSMVSNGYLFDEALAKKAKEKWELTKIQITLDGTEQVYNETKAYISPCESPYKRVLDNICLLLQNGISVDIRLNLGLHNAEDIFALVCELAERFERNKNLFAYSHLLFDDCGFTPTHFEESGIGLLEKKKQELDSLIIALGLASGKSTLPQLKINHCMADNDSSLLILPSGKLGKCEHSIGEHFVGTLETGATDREELRHFKKREESDLCYGCPLYPNCIKLKFCKPEHICTEQMQISRLNTTVRSMVAYYEDFLHNNKESTDSEELPIC